MKRAVLGLLILLFACTGHAEGWQCWNQAAQRYGAPPELLYAIAKQESGLNPRAININPDGSLDLGLMQVNSSWLKQLQPYGITREKLLLDPCLNLHVGAWVLARNFKAYGYNWRAVGAYNANTEWKRANYAMQVYRHLKNIEKGNK